MDIPNIKIVIQWRATPSLSALWQWFGRCARDPTLEGTAIIFTEKEYFNVLPIETKKRKHNISSIKIEPGTSSSAKQAKLGHSMNLSAPNREHEASDDEGDTEGDDEEREDDGDDEDEKDDKDGDEDDGKAKGKRTKRAKHLRKKSKKEKIEPAVFTLLNAHTWGANCCCQPFSDLFENTKASECHICTYTYMFV